MPRKSEFSCSGCRDLQSTYVRDGFDEFYEWKCRAKNLRLIGHDEPFDRCEVPLGCPKVVSLKKRIDKLRSINKRKVQIKNHQKNSVK